MRQVFTSVRLENVEAVEKLLNEAGIQTKVNGGRTWKGNSRREFSYSNKNHDPSQQPSVWVVRPDDFKKAREILHDAGLLETSSQSGGYVPAPLQFRGVAANDPGRKVSKLRILLLVAVLITGVVMTARTLLA
ncbi:MAG: pathogenicity-like protein [Pseudomonadota bacterium]